MSTFALNRTLAEAKGIDLSCHCDGRLPHMMLDGPRIEQVLNNLLSNAINFSYPESVVKVLLARQWDYAVLSVEDSGQGRAAPSGSRGPVLLQVVDHTA